jgi:hypothetical protein
MNVKYTSGLFAVLVLVLSHNAYCLPGESIVFDSKTGNYIITYLGYDDTGESDKPTISRQTIFVPATKIDPVIQSAFKLSHNGVISYSYRVRNGSKARQPLNMFLFDPVTDIASSIPLPKREQDVDPNTIEQYLAASAAALVSPDGWMGQATASSVGGLRIGWVNINTTLPVSGIPSGSERGGFGFSSIDIPGIGNTQLQGEAPVRGFADEGPTGEIADQLEKLTQNDYVTRVAAVPAIAVPVPFDAAVLLERIRTQVATWPSKQLLDPAFLKQIDRYLVAAADAYRLNQPKAAKEHIDTLRRLLERDHKYLDHDDEDNEDTPEHKHATRLTIDRLAARVLDFDLRYVLKRVEREREHEHGGGDHKKER